MNSTDFKPLKNLFGRLHADQSGATLTEFVIMLPLFLLVFQGIVSLGEFTRKGTEAPVVAYKQTFGEALEYQKHFWKMGWNDQSTLGGAASLDQLAGTGLMGESSPAHNRSGAVKLTSNVTEAAAYGMLVKDGTMGESYARAAALTVVPGVDLYGCDSLAVTYPVTECKRLNANNGFRSISLSNGWLDSDLSARTGDADFANSLLADDADVPNFSDYQSGSGWGLLNSFLDDTGVRPALAAGIRYGTVSRRVQTSHSIMGMNMTTDAHFSTLVPPGTQGSVFGVGAAGPRTDAFRATAVVRMTMQGKPYYSKLLGIKWSQPLPKESFTVPEYKP